MLAQVGVGRRVMGAQSPEEEWPHLGGLVFEMGLKDEEEFARKRSIRKMIPGQGVKT
jgi:hypothetical protein